MAGDDDIVVQIAADISDLNSKLDEISGKFKETFSGVEGQTEGLTSVFEGLHNAITTAFDVVGIGLAVEAFEKLRETMSGIAEQAEAIKNTALLYQTNT